MEKKRDKNVSRKKGKQFKIGENRDENILRKTIFF